MKGRKNRGRVKERTKRGNVRGQESGMETRNGNLRQGGYMQVWIGSEDMKEEDNDGTREKGTIKKKCLEMKGSKRKCERRRNREYESVKKRRYIWRLGRRARRTRRKRGV